MSQRHSRNHEKKNNYYHVTNKPKFKSSNKSSRDRGKYYYTSQFQYYNSFMGFPPQWKYFNWTKPQIRRPPLLRTPEKLRPKSPSPGSEEYNLKKIQETSNMIKQQLLMSPETSTGTEVNSQRHNPEVKSYLKSEVTDKKNNRSDSEKTVKSSKKTAEYNVEEIHKKIINHITNLNYGKKMNLICATSSGYDVAIQQIQRQKRLELSKVLREMCSHQTSSESSDVINSIIPDIGIKIEDLPIDVIKELTRTLDLNFEDVSVLNCDHKAVEIKTEVGGNDELVPKYPNLTNIKVEEDTYNEVGVFEEFSMDIEETEFSSNISPKNESSNYLVISKNSEKQTTNIKVETNSHHEVDKVNQYATDSTPQADFFSKLSQNNGKYNQLTDSKNIINTNCANTQTDLTPKISNGTQTDVVKSFQVDNNPENLNTAIETMFEIDKEITRLTELRQSIFVKLNSKCTENSVKVTIKRGTKIKADMKETSKITKCSENNVKVNKQSTKIQKTKTPEKRQTENNMYKNELNFTINADKILVIKLCKDTLIAGSENGKIFYINIGTGQTELRLDLGDFPVTDFCFHKILTKQTHIFIGSFDNKIKEYEFQSEKSIRIIKTHEGVQCMELAWEFIFIGTLGGNLMRYSLKKMKIEFEDRISQDRILVLRATLEGGRRVLLVGTKNAPVCVRDALSGLHMRTMNDIITPTVYSLLLENSLVYCGTTFHDILVYRFHDGTLFHKYKASNSKGVGCIKTVENLLFASCYDGNIYVYNTKIRRYVGVIEGPGGVILSMVILKNLVIVGTMSCNFKSVIIPNYILESNNL